MAKDNEELQLAASDAALDQRIEAAKDLLIGMLQSEPHGESVNRLADIIGNPNDPRFARMWREPAVQMMVSIFAKVGLQLVVGRTLGRNV